MSLGMFLTTWRNKITTSIPSDVPATSVTGILHDHGFLITMSPIVTRYQETDRQGQKISYDVWETIELLPFGIWKREIQFSCAFENTAEGVVSWIKAPLGLTSRAIYAVESVDGQADKAVLDESIESSCNVLLKVFVESTMVATRKKMHARIMEKAKER